MLVALVDQAVEKLVRGPTSTTACVGSLPSKMLTPVSCSGSKVSRSSLCTLRGGEKVCARTHVHERKTGARGGQRASTRAAGLVWAGRQAGKRVGVAQQHTPHCCALSMRAAHITPAPPCCSSQLQAQGPWDQHKL